ncbi:sarcocystatin-A-like isoform X1 [Anastrepha obliqua]|uniref:sarcocystatin-A-like isoform X1 n=1 Tax=Anastrepha obliqua TaxID=95512 RepID=UPI00240A69BF|nr:sarcocystatin-A-like isoform X1 [Anastrepha obliqua]
MVSTKLFVLLSCVFVAVLAVPQGQLVGAPSKLSGADLKEAEETLKTSLSKLAAGDGPNYNLSKIISVTRQVVSGTLYKYDVELVDSYGAKKNCNVEIWNQPWLENGTEVTFKCPGEEVVKKKHSP